LLYGLHTCLPYIYVTDSCYADHRLESFIDLEFVNTSLCAARFKIKSRPRT
ncbi:hypothetical protein WOLCODRAFT_138015, partial [Wolfiporia cocos MD-104 SS10]